MSNIQEKYQYSTPDGRFGIEILSKEMSTILKYCSEAKRQETGGILIGYYTDGYNMAVITHVSAPPIDSKCSTNFFVRGIKGLQRLLNKLWQYKEYYLGEWHFHPYVAPIPSERDHHQMLTFSCKDTLKCPEPVLLIIGGDPKSVWSAKVIVYPRGQSALEMIEVGKLTRT